MARTDYGAILSTRIADTSQAIRDVNGTSGLIAPADWGTQIRTMKSASDYQNALEQMIEETASGAIASFTDGANNIPCPSVLCTISPVQDLHGQDYPYPSGGGKNKVNIADITVTSQSFYAIGVLNSGTYTFSFNIKNNTSIDGTVRVYRYQGSDLGSYSVIANDNKRASITFTLTEETDVRFAVSGRSSGYNYNLTNFQLELGSSATPYAPYSNICPITGHTELNLVHTGANIWDEVTEQGAYNNRGEKISYAVLRNKNPIYVEGIPSVYFYCGTSGVTARVVFYTKTMSCISSTPETVLNSVISVPNNACYMSFNLDTNYGTTYGNNVSINAPSNYTQYNAYNPSTTTTDLGTTVYGGTLDVVSGVLTIDRAIISNLANYTWIRGQSGSVYAFVTNLDVSTYESYSECVCSSYKWSDSRYINKLPNMCLMTYLQGRTNRIAIRNDNYEDVTSFVENLSGTQLVIPLATPTTTHLTPTEVKSLLGSNNIYHDCNGQVAVTYKANGNLYVAQH